MYPAATQLDDVVPTHPRNAHSSDTAVRVHLPSGDMHPHRKARNQATPFDVTRALLLPVLPFLPLETTPFVVSRSLLLPLFLSYSLDRQHSLKPHRLMSPILL